MLLDLYALAPARTEAISNQFRSTWLRRFKESADDYEVPQYADNPDVIYTSVDDLIRKLVASPMETHAIYWRNSQPGPIRHGMLFFTKDGSMIVGLSVDEERSDHAKQLLCELATTIGAVHGYATIEEPPPDRTAEFLARARSASIRIGNP
jgi:hypothetical protein